MPHKARQKSKEDLERWGGQTHPTGHSVIPAGHPLQVILGRGGISLSMMAGTSDISPFRKPYLLV